MLIRRAMPDDSPAIFAVHSAAFARPDVDVPVEAPLVQQLEQDGDLVPALCLVAEQDGVIVGHVASSRGSLGGRGVVGLGPLGVHPDSQGSGVGSALMHAVIGGAEALDEPALVLLGEPAYYSRFGFEAAQRVGVQPQDPAWGKYFQIRRLRLWDDALHGTYQYASAFTGL